MKVISIMGILAGLVGVAMLGGSPAYAQSEVAPDHFESSNVEPFEKPKTNASNEAAAIRYDRKFTLPYTVQCSGKSLPPGKYSVSLHSDGTPWNSREFVVKDCDGRLLALRRELVVCLGSNILERQRR